MTSAQHAPSRRRTRRQVDAACDARLGTLIRNRRLELGLSQTALATTLGVSFQQVQKYEKGTNQVSVSRLLQIATALRAPLDYFLDLRARPIPHEAIDVDLARALSRIRSPRIKRALIGLARALALGGGASLSRADQSVRDKRHAARR